jgi:hypothetical protein
MTLRTLRGGSVYNGMKHAVVAALLLAVAFAVALMRSPKGSDMEIAGNTRPFPSETGPVTRAN